MDTAITIDSKKRNQKEWNKIILKFVGRVNRWKKQWQLLKTKQNKTTGLLQNMKCSDDLLPVE